MNVEVESYLEKNPQKIMAQHGKSFYWASRFFNKKMLHEVSSLYTFCRYVDDLADECAPKVATEKLGEVLNNIDKDNSHFSQIFGQDKIDPTFAKELLDGALFDVNEGKIITRDDLIVYCYKVAGVVGLMMTKVIGVKDVNANAFAIDLGLGMQLTNICRDILEDAQNNRTYLPQNELDVQKLNIDRIKINGQTPNSLKTIVNYYLTLADTYYDSAISGLHYIPWRARFVILTAARLYQAIGHKIRYDNFNVLQGRTYLNSFEKLMISFKVIFEFLFLQSKKSTNHKPHLHTSLKGLPGIKV